MLECFYEFVEVSYSKVSVLTIMNNNIFYWKHKESEYNDSLAGSTKQTSLVTPNLNFADKYI